MRSRINGVVRLRCPCDLAHSISCPHGVDCMVLRLSQGHLASIHALRPPEEEPACAWIPGRSTHDRNRIAPFATLPRPGELRQPPTSGSTKPRHGAQRTPAAGALFSDH